MLISTAAIAAQDKDLVFIIPTKKARSARKGMKIKVRNCASPDSPLQPDMISGEVINCFKRKGGKALYQQT